MGPKKRPRASGRRKRAAGGKMSKAYRALLRERPELAAISDAEISSAAAAIDLVDRMTAGTEECGGRDRRLERRNAPRQRYHLRRPYRQARRAADRVRPHSSRATVL
jgi:hypothetical protein